MLICATNQIPAIRYQLEIFTFFCYEDGHNMIIEKNFEQELLRAKATKYCFNYESFY